MKVIKQVMITLVLAVPISPISLVTADELVIKETTLAYQLGTADYTPDLQEALKLAPVKFETATPAPEAVQPDAKAGARTLNKGVAYTGR
jgi:hypothetical protein